MAGKRQRQQRVRHEAGGETPAAVSQPDTKTAPQAANPTSGPPPPTSKNNQSYSNNVTTTSKPARGRGGRRGVVTVDQTPQYQPVTIMESKKEGDTDELDDAPRTKYKRRGIVSNWSRYEERNPALDELDDGTDYLIGEDFSTVLLNQSQGGSGGGHLLLKGEEGWGGHTQDNLCTGRYGIGAVRVEDLAATMATVSFMEQLGIDSSALPKQLAEHYDQLAADNRRLYDPTAATPELVDTADIIEQQMRSLRLSFFDSESDDLSTSEKNVSSMVNVQSKIDKKQIIEQLDEEDDPFIDFALSEEIPDNMQSGVKVDLTEKMCLAFGSDINSVIDDFDSTTFNNCYDEEEKVSSESFEKKHSKQFKTSENNINNTSKSAKNTTNLLTKEPEEDPLDFSAGHDDDGTFNFGLPKPSYSFGSNVEPISKLSVTTNTSKVTLAVQDDEDIFLPPPAKSPELVKSPVVAQHPDVDICAPIVPPAVSLVTTADETKELEDWLDSVLDD